MCTTSIQRRRALHNSETNDTQRTSWSSFSRTPLVATATIFGVLMLVFHVKADALDLHGSDKPLFFDRLKMGPAGLSKADLILFGAVFLLAFELLQFLVEGSGSKLQQLSRDANAKRKSRSVDILGISDIFVFPFCRMVRSEFNSCPRKALGQPQKGTHGSV